MAQRLVALFPGDFGHVIGVAHEDDDWYTVGDVVPGTVSGTIDTGTQTQSLSEALNWAIERAGFDIATRLPLH